MAVSSEKLAQQLRLGLCCHMPENEDVNLSGEKHKHPLALMDRALEHPAFFTKIV